MRKLMIGAVAALTFLGAALPAAEALARDGRHYRYDNYGGYSGYGRYSGYGGDSHYNGYSRYDGHHGYDYGRRHKHHRNNNDEAAIVAGIAALAIGAALASGGGRSRDRYDDDGYRYDRAPRSSYGYYDRGSRRCRTTTDWDPWADAYIRRTRCW